MSLTGHSRPGRADNKSSHVRHAPIAIKSCAAEQFRCVPNPAVTTSARKLDSKRRYPATTHSLQEVEMIHEDCPGGRFQYLNPA